MNSEEWAEKFRRYLVERCGKSHGTAVNYSGTVKKLLSAHPQGANHAEITAFKAEQRGTHTDSALRLFSPWILEATGVFFEVNLPTTPKLIGVSDAHRVVAQIFQGLDTKIPLSVTWEDLPPVETWAFRGQTLAEPQVVALAGMLRELRRLGRGSPLVFAKGEGSKYECFNLDDMKTEESNG